MKKSILIAVTTSLVVSAALYALPRTMSPAVAAAMNEAADREDSIKVVPATTSIITKLPLPEGAVRVKDASIPAAYRKKLASMAAGMGPRYKQTKVEVIVWTGSKFKPSQIDAIKAEMDATMNGNGWSYGDIVSDGGSKKMTRVCALTRKDQGILGFFASTDEALVLGWTEILPIEAADDAAVSDATETLTIPQP